MHLAALSRRQGTGQEEECFLPGTGLDLAIQEGSGPTGQEEKEFLRLRSGGKGQGQQLPGHLQEQGPPGRETAGLMQRTGRLGQDIEHAGVAQEGTQVGVVVQDAHQVFGQEASQVAAGEEVVQFADLQDGGAGKPGLEEGKFTAAAGDDVAMGDPEAAEEGGEGGQPLYLMGRRNLPQAVEEEEPGPLATQGFQGGRAGLGQAETPQDSHQQVRDGTAPIGRKVHIERQGGRRFARGLFQLGQAGLGPLQGQPTQEKRLPRAGLPQEDQRRKALQGVIGGQGHPPGRLLLQSSARQQPEGHVLLSGLLKGGFLLKGQKVGPQEGIPARRTCLLHRFP